MKRYTFMLPPETEKKLRALYAVSALCPAVLFLVTGLLDDEMGRVLYTALPFAVMFLPVVFLPASAFPIVIGKNLFFEKQYGRIFTRGKICGWISFFLGLWCAAGTIFYCVGHPEIATAQIPFGLGCLTISAASWVFARCHKQISKFVSLATDYICSPDEKTV